MLAYFLAEYFRYGIDKRGYCGKIATGVLMSSGRSILVSGESFSRLCAIAHEMRAESGKSVTFGEVIEDLLDDRGKAGQVRPAAVRRDGGHAVLAAPDRHPDGD